MLMQEVVKLKSEAPSSEQLVSGAVSILQKVPVAAFSLADLLISHCGQKPEREEAVASCLLERLEHDKEAAPAEKSSHESLLAAAHLLAVLCDASPSMRIAAIEKGAACLGLPEASVCYTSTRLCVYIECKARMATRHSE